MATPANLVNYTVPAGCVVIYCLISAGCKPSARAMGFNNIGRLLEGKGPSTDRVIASVVQESELKHSHPDQAGSDRLYYADAKATLSRTDIGSVTDLLK